MSREKWVISYSHIDDAFDYEPLDFHVASNLGTYVSGGTTFYTIVSIVDDVEDCVSEIHRLRKMIPKCNPKPKPKSQNKLNKIEMEIVSLTWPNLLDWRKLSPEQRQQLCEENFDLDFPDEKIDDPEGDYFK